ncbi:carboxypeptidase-like regulatory domain-containing protein [Nocardioides campestrisoli]|uniref:carboxypeptidase-like regulatory domain-containing protein n=1 Tax=Nocardioides campestrisoli TaxID=2736757 RepID=UPI00163DB5BD|nr:carboxypeptidase-like regulatory domain-containing protein [Nocardioides campestrisoli]
MLNTVVRRLLSTSLAALLTLTGLTLAGSATLAPASAAVGATLTGRVVGEDGRVPSTHTSVRVQKPGAGRWDTIAQATTDYFGQYSVTGIPAGTYRVELEQIDHLVQHQQVTLTEGVEQWLDVVLDRGAAIAGRVVLPAGGVLTSSFVRVFARTSSPGQAPWQQVDYAFVEPSGEYMASGFPAGTYRVGVFPVGETYPVEYYDNVTRVDDAVDLVVASDGTLTGIDFDLGTAPVTVPSTEPVPKPQVTLGKPRLAGKPRVGKVLKIRGLRPAPSAAKVSYRWSVGGAKVRRAGTPSLRLTRSMAGKRVKVTVVARAAGHQRAKVVLTARARVRR